MPFFLKHGAFQVNEKSWGWIDVDKGASVLDWNYSDNEIFLGYAEVKGEVKKDKNLYNAVNFF